ncbi:MAG: two-component sensor histidine kinase [Paracoccus denitrificans]|nr:MAG: two-component sensor histidine kinase [Paracoccus denitrificans]PZO83920.1 MAG: two-component sensor histidine kinase [Paracoccus denitrificans]
MPWRHGTPVMAAIMVALLALTVFGQIATRQAFHAAQGRATNALRLTVNALEADLARYEVVPQLIADLDMIRRLAADPRNHVLRQQTNLWLAAKNAEVQASDIYLIRPDGETIAHSGYEGPQSFIGQNFSFRPYFIDAMAGRPARFYGVGTTSGVRGYYFSAPVRDGRGEISAVIAVKIGVDRMEEAWHGSDYRVLVTDPEGMTFLASDPGWLYHAITPLTAERRARTAASRRYATQPMAEFGEAVQSKSGVPMLRLPDPGPGRAASRDYIVASEPMQDAGWTVHVLVNASTARAEARLATISLALLMALGGVGAMMWRQRRAQVAERLAAQAFATAELERRVVARTADLARVNGQLEQEIHERRVTEAELRTAQAGLVQVGKLAALGQMSASVSHEINQPLAAARNYADSAAILIERGEYARARANITEIMSLIDRMAAIGRHLRSAARNPDDQLGAVDLAALVPETRTIVAARLDSVGATLDVDLPADLPALRAGPTRLQQVLVNLITNAADAVEGLEDRAITLSAVVQADRVVLTVRDRGPGVAPPIAARIFDPFFTTKGTGLGLGLSITANIVRDLGGTITVADAGPGVAFCVTLPTASGRAA